MAPEMMIDNPNIDPSLPFFSPSFLHLLNRDLTKFNILTHLPPLNNPFTICHAPLPSFKPNSPHPNLPPLLTPPPIPPKRDLTAFLANPLLLLLNHPSSIYYAPLFSHNHSRPHLLTLPPPKSRSDDILGHPNCTTPH